MSRHVDAAFGALALTVLLLLAGVPAAGQRFTPPRTPWGDPDLQGDYSNKYEQGTPFERPAEFDGRRLEDITGAELAALVRERASEVLLNAPFTGGDPVAGNFGGAPAFYDRFEADKGSRPWLVINPPDGKIPPMSPEGRQASTARAAARTAQRRGRGPADSYRGPKPVRPLHYARASCVDDADQLRQLLPDRSGSRVCGHHLRDGARDAHHPARRPRTARPLDSSIHGGGAWTLGGRHAGGGDHQLQGRTSLPRGES